MANIDKQGKVGPEGFAGTSFDQVAPLARPHAPAAQCKIWDDDGATMGYAGADGMAGTNGGLGGDGTNGAMSIFEIGLLDFSVSFNVRGGNGGVGGRGGNGQNGGPGGQGGDGRECEFPRNGGKGGKGGDAGGGGSGGNGGRGGRISLLYKQGLALPVIDIDNSGGSRGLPGPPGVPGFRGEPGGQGQGGGEFSSSSDCENSGPVPDFGAPGIVLPSGNPGQTGADGPEPEKKQVA